MTKYFAYPVVLLLLITSLAWTQTQTNSSDPRSGSATSSEKATLCLKTPTRPTNVIEIFRYEFGRYPIVSESGKLYYEIKTDGLTLSIPYETSEDSALEELRLYYHHPLPGMQSDEIARLLLLLEPEQPHHGVVMQKEHSGGSSEAAAYTVQMQVDRSFIPDADPWGVAVVSGSQGKLLEDTHEICRLDAATLQAAGTKEFPSASSASGSATIASRSKPAAKEANPWALPPETVVGKVHNRKMPFVTQHLGTAWCLSSNCDRMVTNYHVAELVGDNCAVNGMRVIKKIVATGADDIDVGTLKVGYENREIKANFVRDLAILEMKKPLSERGMHGVPLFPGDLNPGESALIFSFPNGKLTITTGRFHASNKQGILEFDLDSALAPGSSGGLILNADSQGIGVLFGLDSSRRKAFAVPVWSLAEFVKKTDPKLYVDLFPLPPQRPNLSSTKVLAEEPIIEISAHF